MHPHRRRTNVISLGMAVVMTMAMLLGIDTLSATESATANWAQAPATKLTPSQAEPAPPRTAT